MWTLENVLAEFDVVLDDWPDCKAKRWVEAHPPTVDDACDVAFRMFSIRSLDSWKPAGAKLAKR